MGVMEEGVMEKRTRDDCGVVEGARGEWMRVT